MYILGYRQINCFYHVLYNYYNQNEKSLIEPLVICPGRLCGTNVLPSE